MIEFKITVINNKTGDIIDEFVSDFEGTDEIIDTMEYEIHNYDIPYNDLFYEFQEY